MTVSAGPSSLLLVDDDPTFCQVLGLALSRRGFAVATARDITAALRQARVEAPEYAVVDLNLAGDSGLSLIPPTFRTPLSHLPNKFFHTAPPVVLAGASDIDSY